MAAVSTPLAEHASSIFTELGYSVSRTDNELRAERKWRVVHVTLSEPTTIPTEGQLRCFVTAPDSATKTYRRVSMADPEYDWAVIAVEEDGDYEVYRPSPEPTAEP
jgi:hypothetical protein